MPKLEYSVVGGIFEQPSGKCVEVGTSDWWNWLESDEAKSFRFETDHGVKSYTARKETIQSKGYFWYAYKKVDKRLHKSYIGKTAELTLERLEAVAGSLGQPKAIKLHTELGNQGENELPSELHNLVGNPESEIDKLRARLTELEQSNSELQSANESLEKQLSECSMQKADIQRAYEREADDAKRYYPGWRKLPGLESELRYHKGKSAKAEGLIEALKAAKRYKLHGKEVVKVEDFESFL